VLIAAMRGEYAVCSTVYQFGARLKYFKSGGGWSFFMGMMVPSALRK
jgi:hypothetical protein